MTLWYLIGALVVLGLALLTVTGSGGPAPELVIWIGRVLPAVSALVACIAFCMVVARGAGAVRHPGGYLLLRIDRGPGPAARAAVRAVGAEFQFLRDALDGRSSADNLSCDGALASGVRFEEEGPLASDTRHDQADR
jgi:hypothetical protein